MPTDAQKAQFLTKVKEMMSMLGQVEDSIRTLSSIYTNRGYASNGSDPITQVHLDSFGVVPADVTAMVNVVTALQNFFSGVTVNGNIVHKQTIDKWRQV